MDKQMIEEMAKLVQGDMCGDVPCEECNYNGKMKILPRYCGVYLIAEKLYNAGYREIPEGAVVMTREEKEKLYYPDEVWQMVENARKETAKKFAEKLFEVFDEYFLYDRAFINRKINEICKEITGGEKEISNETV